MSATFVIEGLTKTYRMGETEVHALRGVNLTVNKGEMIVLLGPSGSGKSTFLNIVGGLDTPTSGRVLFEGQDIGKYTEDELTYYRRNHVGFVFQAYNLVPSLTAQENVELVTEISPDPLPAAEALELVGLGERRRHFPAQLSGGEQQRVAIARAIVTNPELLLADEPTGNLDSKRSAEVMELLARLNRDQGITIVMVTHEPDMAAYARRVVTFLDGHIVSDERQSGVV